MHKIGGTAVRLMTVAVGNDLLCRASNALWERGTASSGLSGVAELALVGVTVLLASRLIRLVRAEAVQLAV